MTGGTNAQASKRYASGTFEVEGGQGPVTIPPVGFEIAVLAASNIARISGVINEYAYANIGCIRNSSNVLVAYDGSGFYRESATIVQNVDGSLTITPGSARVRTAGTWHWLAIGLEDAG